MKKMVIAFCDDEIMGIFKTIENAVIFEADDMQSLYREAKNGADYVIVCDCGIDCRVKEFYDKLRSIYEENILIVAYNDEWNEILDSISDDPKTDMIIQYEGKSNLVFRLKKIISGMKRIDAIEKMNVARNEIDGMAKLSIAGELVSSVGHMVNNPITAINLELDLIKMDKSLTKEQLKKIETVEENIEKVINIINTVRELKFGVSDRSELVNINDEISRYIPVLHDYFMNHRMLIDYSYDQKMPPVRMPVGLLKYIFLEIMILAFHSGKDKKGSKVTVKVVREKENVAIRFNMNFKCNICESGLVHEENESSEDETHNNDRLTIRALKNDILNANGSLEHESAGEGFSMTIRFPLAKI